MRDDLLTWISTSGRLLGALFYYEPQAPELQPVLSFFQQPDWTEQWITLKESGQIVSLLAQRENLDEQYQTLFIGPNSLPAPPWGSVYLDRESVMFGDSLLKLREFMRRHKIEFRRTQDEPEDHIGLMLMLAAYLVENRPELLAEYLGEHLLIWADHYLQLLAGQQNYPFYRGLALLTRQTLQDWRRQGEIQVAAATFYR